MVAPRRAARAYIIRAHRKSTWETDRPNLQPGRLHLSTSTDKDATQLLVLYLLAEITRLWPDDVWMSLMSCAVWIFAWRRPSRPSHSADTHTQSL